MTDVLPWRETRDGVELAVRLTPGGGANGVQGVAIQDGQPCLSVRVAAPPVDGAANDALMLWLSKALRLPRSHVTLIAGDKARVKRIGLRGAGLPDRLAALLAAA